MRDCTISEIAARPKNLNSSFDREVISHHFFDRANCFNCIRDLTGSLPVAASQYPREFAKDWDWYCKQGCAIKQCLCHCGLLSVVTQNGTQKYVGIECDFHVLPAQPAAADSRICSIVRLSVFECSNIPKMVDTDVPAFGRI